MSTTPPISPSNGLHREIGLAIERLRSGEQEVLHKVDGIVGEINRRLEGLPAAQYPDGAVAQIERSLDAIRNELGRHEALLAANADRERAATAEERRNWSASAEALTKVAEVLATLDAAVADQRGRWPLLDKSLGELSAKLSSLGQGMPAEHLRGAVEPVIMAMDTRLIELAQGLEAAMSGLYRLVQEAERRGKSADATIDQRLAKVTASLEALQRGNGHDPQIATLQEAVHGYGAQLTDLTGRLSELHQDSAIRAEAKQTLVSDKLNRLFQAIKEIKVEPDLSPVTEAVEGLGSRFDSVMQKLEGLSLKATRLEFLAGEANRTDAQDARFETLGNSVSDLGSKLAEISQQISTLHQDQAVRAEAKQALVAEKLNRVLAAVREPVPAPDLSAVTEAMGTVEKRFETVLQKLEGLSLKATRIEFLASEANGRIAPEAPERVEHLRGMIERAIADGRGANRGVDESGIASLATRLDDIEEAARVDRRNATAAREIAVGEIKGALASTEARLLARLSSRGDDAAPELGQIHSANVETKLDNVAAAIVELHDQVSGIQASFAASEDRLAQTAQGEAAQTAGARTSFTQLLTAFRMMLRQIGDDAHAFHETVGKAGAAAHAGQSHPAEDQLAKLTAEIERLASAVSVRQAAPAAAVEADAHARDRVILDALARLERRIDAISAPQGPSADIGREVGELMRMVAVGNEVLAEMHAVSSPARTLAPQSKELPTWTEAWQVIATVTQNFERRFADLATRVDSLSGALEKGGAGANGLSAGALDGLKSGLDEAKRDLSRDVDRFLSIAASLSSDMEELAPKVLAQRLTAAG